MPISMSSTLLLNGFCVVPVSALLGALAASGLKSPSSAGEAADVFVKDRRDDRSGLVAPDAPMPPIDMGVSLIELPATCGRRTTQSTPRAETRKTDVLEKRR